MTFLPVLLLLWVIPPSDAAHRLRTFHLGEEKMNITDARDFCTQNYTDIVTVYDEQDNLELKKLLVNINVNISRISSAWIGARRNGTKISKKWSNGDDDIFRNLTGDCGEICCAVMKANGAWDPIQCNETRYFMCYDQDASQTSDKYKLIDQNKTWFDAQRFCREKHTDLVTIRDQTENNQVKEKGKNSSKPFWIGLLKDNVEWFDEGKSAYRKYPVTQSGDFTKLFHNGSWIKIGGGNNAPPLCYKSHIHVSNVTMSWEKALDYCDNDPNTSGLLRIESEDDQIETERELRRKKISGPVWVGLRQSRLFGFWIWSNGLHVGPWTNWKGGSQPEHQMSHHCGAIEKMNGQFKWTDKDCRSKFIVLCERK